MEKKDIKIILMENTLNEKEKEVVMSQEEKQAVTNAKKSGILLLGG
jgi:hypothetical protein